MSRPRTSECLPFAWLAAFAMLAVTGCAPLDLHKVRLPWQDKEPQYEMPERVVTFWSDTVLHQPSKPALRGFGGRIFFYAADQTRPIEVDGTLVVYAFDAEHQDPSQQKPEKKFVFEADRLQEHFSQSDMGPSYSVWLPWDDVQGPTRSISLVARFEGREGGTVISRPANKLLPGTGTLKTMQVSKGQRPGPEIVQVGAQEPIAEDNAEGQAVDVLTPASDPRASTESIDVPPSFLRRLHQEDEGEAAKTNVRSTIPASESAADSTGHSGPSTFPPATADGAPPRANPPRPAAQDSPAAHSESPTRPARTTAGLPQSPLPLRRGPRLAGSLSALPSTPRFGSNRTSAATGPVYRGPGALEDLSQRAVNPRPD